MVDTDQTAVSPEYCKELSTTESLTTFHMSSVLCTETQVEHPKLRQNGNASSTG